jgi:PAS domain S-box-containing protein
VTFRERPWLVALAAGLVAGGIALALVLTSDHVENTALQSVLGLVLGWSFIGSGIFAWARRPENRTGRLMVAVGFVWFLGSLSASNSSVVYTIGTAFGALSLAAFIHLLFAFPNGRLEWRSERIIVALAYPAALLANVTGLLVDSQPTTGCSNCPANTALVVDSHTATNGLMFFWNVVGGAFMIATAVVLVRRWRAATAPARRVLAPVYIGGLASVSLLFVGFAVQGFSGVGDAIATVAILCFISVPYLFLVGLLRTRLARTAATQLIQEAPEAPSFDAVEATLRRTLNDPTLRFLVREESCDYVDTAGRNVEVPEESETVAVTRLVYDGQPIAAVVHDPALREEPELLDDVLAATRLALIKDQTVEALRASERRNRALLSALPDNMFLIRGDGTYVDFYSNDPDALSLPPDRIIGSRIGEHLPAEDVELRMGTIRRVIATGEPAVFELEIVDPRGNTGVREVRMVRSGRDEVLAITRDVTDRKRAEEEVLRQRDFLSTVVNTAKSIFCVVATDGSIVRFNSFCEQLTGLTDDDSTRGRLFWDLFAAPEDVDAIRAAFAADVPGLEYENRWGTADGGWRLVLWSVTPLIDESGAERRLIHGVDITSERHQQEELRRSRARIVEAESAERRRLERNLHDGAQQRLVSLSLALRMAQSRIEKDPTGAAEMLAGASAELTLALEELREIARGIHPAILSDRGLNLALEALATRAPLPVELDAVPAERLPEQVEAAAFYVVSEALTNVAKYARASCARVRVAREDGVVDIEVVDDGIGGADEALGTGLRGLADRVEALDGRFVVESAQGRGTSVRAAIPLPAAGGSDEVRIAAPRVSG